MQAHNDTINNHFDEIPDEILQHILSFLPNPSDVRSLALVDKRFLVAMQAVFPTYIKENNLEGRWLTHSNNIRGQILDHERLLRPVRIDRQIVGTFIIAFAFLSVLTSNSSNPNVNKSIFATMAIFAVTALVIKMCSDCVNRYNAPRRQIVNRVNQARNFAATRELQGHVQSVSPYSLFGTLTQANTNPDITSNSHLSFLARKNK